MSDSSIKFEKRIVRILVAFIIVFAVTMTGITENASAATYSISKDYFYKSSNLASDYIKIKISGRNIKVYGKAGLHKHKYYRVVIRNDKTGQATYWGPVRAYKSSGEFSTTISTKAFKSTRLKGGTGDIMIKNYNKKSGTDSTDGNGYTLWGVPLNFKNLKAPYMIRFGGVAKCNDDIRAKLSALNPKAYLDVSMNTEFTGSFGQYPMTEEEANIIAEKSNEICKGISSNYTKLRKIYEYVTGNLYYDSYGFAGKYVPEKNAYRLLDAIESNKKAATVCDGYSALFASLARAQGIPARLVSGHALYTPKRDWSTEQNREVRDHVWNEAYVNGRWITVDCTRGTNSKYYNAKYDGGKHKTYTYGGVCNYIYFDITKDALAITHKAMKGKGGGFNYKYSSSSDVKKIKEFLEITTESGKKNIDILPSDYLTPKANSADKKYVDVDYEGRLVDLAWSNDEGSSDEMEGKLDLSGCNRLLVLSAFCHNISEVDLTSCSSLKAIYLNSNNIRRIDASASKNLEIFKFKGNPATYIKFKEKSGSNVTLKAEGGGTIGITYSKTENILTVFAKPDKGGSLDGIYDSNGELMSEEIDNPIANYVVKFK